MPRTARRNQQERDQRILAALYAISLAGRSQPTLRAIFETIASELARVFDFDACYIAFCDEQPETFKGALLVDEGHVQYLEGNEYGYLTGIIVRRREPMLFQDLVRERDPSAPPIPFGQVDKRSRSWVGVPLMISSEAVGVISLQSYQVGIYDAETLDLLQRMGNVIAVALENVVLIEQQERLGRELAAQVAARGAELAALSAIAATLVDQRPLSELLDRALAVAIGALHLDAGNVRLLDAAGETLVLHAERGFSPEYVAQAARSPLATSPLREVVLGGRPQIIARGWHTRYDPARFPLHLFPRFECAISMPLLVGERVLGTLTIFGMHPREIAPREIELSRSIANQIAILIENTRLIEERERQIGELRAMSEISLAASTAQTSRELLRRVSHALSNFLALDAFAMVIYDPRRAVISDGITIDEGQIYDYWAGQPPPPRSLTAYILRERRPLHFHDLPAEIGELPGVESMIIGADRTARSWIGVPLLDRAGAAIGALNVQSYRAGLFSARDAEFLTSVAAQVALHVQNVALLTQRARQIAELEVIGQIGTLVTASYDLGRILDEVRQLLVDLTDAAVFYLLLCDPLTRRISHAVFVEQGQSYALELVGEPVRPGSLTDWILTNREPLLFSDLLVERAQMQTHGIAPHPLGPQHPVRSWAGVPLVAHDGELIGVLSLQDYRAYRYDQSTLEFLGQVATHISLGVQKVRLFEERERQAVENARLFESAQAHAIAAERQATRMALVNRIAGLLAARLDQQAILDIAARELVELFWADHTGLLIFHSAGYGSVVAEYPATGALGVGVDLHDNPLVEALRTTRRPQVIEDLAGDPRAAISGPHWRALGIRALVVVPLISRDRVFGSISLDSFSEPRRYSEEELELMLTVTTSVATAYENALLFAAEQEQRQTAETLREMARVLSSSFDPGEVLQLVLGELQKVIAYDTATIMLIDGAQLRIAASRGWPAEQELRGFALTVDASGAGEVVRRREPVLRTAGPQGTIWPADDVGARIRTWLGVPLIAKGRVLGVLNIDSYSPGAFGERDIEVARTFANHAALAIENAQLYQESVARVEQEMAIARHIQANLFPRDLPSCPGLSVAARCLPARETGGDFYDVVDLGARVGVIIGDVSGKSLPAAMLMAVARSTARSEARNHETPRVVLAETNRWLVDDVPRNAFVALGYALIDPAERRLTLSNAGQIAPLLRHADGSTTFLETAGALPLGVRRETRYNQVELALEPGDTLVFCTDGIVEARDQRRELFGFERLERLVRRWGHLPPAELLDCLLAEVHAFSEGTPTHDDMTLVVVRVDL